MHVLRLPAAKLRKYQLLSTYSCFKLAKVLMPPNGMVVSCRFIDKSLQRMKKKIAVSQKYISFYLLFLAENVFPRKNAISVDVIRLRISIWNKNGEKKHLFPINFLQIWNDLETLTVTRSLWYFQSHFLGSLLFGFRGVTYIKRHK